MFVPIPVYMEDPTIPATIPATVIVETTETATAVDTAVMDPAEEKRLKRMKRNRESAAESRNRKQQYLDSLEAEVKALKQKVADLEAELEEVRARARLFYWRSPPPCERSRLAPQRARNYANVCARVFVLRAGKEVRRWRTRGSEGRRGATRARGRPVKVNRRCEGLCACGAHTGHEEH